MELISSPKGQGDPNVEYMTEEEWDEWTSKNQTKPKTFLETLVEMERQDDPNNNPPYLLFTDRISISSLEMAEGRMGQYKRWLNFEGRMMMNHNPSLYDYRLYAYRRDIFVKI